jgi:two-component system, chemotaxis family, protein-glutamate methylesterase/glutaminase
MTRLLIVDDSALTRKLLTDVFGAEPDFEIRTARNGVEALALLATYRPDVITLDINMPSMDGLTCLDRIMVEHPCPVVMVSSLTAQGAEATLQALHLGAVDFVTKPGGAISLSINELAGELVAKVRGAAMAKPRASLRLKERVRHRLRAPSADGQPRAALTGRSGEGRSGEGSSREGNSGKGRSSESRSGEGDSGRGNSGRGRSGWSKSGEGRSGGSKSGEGKPKPSGDGLVLVGTSTGGPPALETLLTGLPASFPWPVLIAQHMPASFTGALARRLDGLSALTITEVVKPVQLIPGRAYIGMGDADIIVSSRATGLVAMPAPPDPDWPWHPSTDRLVRTAMNHLPASQLIGVLMTGMGSDGAAAMAELLGKGGTTIAEARETAVVWGMPGELVTMNGADRVVPLHGIADCLTRLLS